MMGATVEFQLPIDLGLAQLLNPRDRKHPDLPIYGTMNRSAGTRAIDATRGGGQKISVSIDDGK